MSDTEISYKYKDKFHPDVKSGTLTLERGLFKKYIGSYDTQYFDPLSKIERRLWNCGLIAKGERVNQLLHDILTYLSEIGFTEENEDFKKLSELYDFLMQQKPIEFVFECW